MKQMKSEVREGTKIDWHAPIENDDGVAPRANVFGPLGDPSGVAFESAR